VQLEVPGDREGERLDQFLAGALGSRARAQRLIEAGHVTVDGATRPKRHVVQAGERVVVEEEVDPAPPTVGTAPFDLHFEDDHLMVVDKPAGVVVHPARGHRTGTLAQALAGRAGGGDEEWRAGIVHRLDRDTSGLLVVAKDDRTHRALKAALASRAIEREYLALVDGRPSARRGTIDAAIGRDRRVRTRISTETDEPREARTHFVLERPLPAASLLRVTLETGRTHQIRVHLAAIGHPVCGDPEYGVAGRYGLERQFLHAVALRFDHPVTGEHLDVSSPLPDDLARALRLAEDA
jgi:23S rRNA pseudouridine1911/1915/1917 synthase